MPRIFRLSFIFGVLVSTISGCSLFDGGTEELYLQEDLEPFPLETQTLGGEGATYDQGALDPYAQPPIDDGTLITGYGQEPVYGATTGGDSNDLSVGALRERLIYFDTNQESVREEFRSVINAHGSFLVANGDATIRLEGHTDERGSREFNIALGERRAQSVRRLLLVAGARPEQVLVISLGEEQPIADGHDESAWAQNRRVEIVYENR